MQRKHARRLIFSLAIMLPVLGLSGTLSALAYHSQKAVHLSAARLRRTLQHDEADGVSKQQLQSVSKQLQHIDTRHIGPIPASWFAMYDGTNKALQDLSIKTSSLWTRSLQRSKRKAETSLKALEATMGPFAQTGHKMREQALRQASTPTGFRQLAGSWRVKQQSWQATILKLKQVSGGYHNYHPVDIETELSRLTTLLKKAPKVKKVAAARAAVKGAQTYLKDTPQEQLSQHAKEKKILEDAIHNVHQAETNPFGPAFLSYLKTRDSQVSVAVYNAKTGKTVSYHSRQRYDTASIVKASIMADLLHQSQQTHKPVTQTEKQLMTPMIEVSSNQAATKLWNIAGGAYGMDKFLHSIGMNHTTPGPNGYWGLTTTTVIDQVDLMKLYAFPNHILDNANRQYGLSLMKHIVGWEDWGVSTGAKGKAAVALKNGWVPVGVHHWYVNSIGFIDGDGRDYVIAVMSQHNPSEQYGIQTVDKVSQMVWEALG